MPTVIDRRLCLLSAAAIGLLGPSGAVAQASASGPSGQWLAAAWYSAHGGQAHIGLVRANPGGRHTIGPNLRVPTRAHGLVVATDGSVIAVARRPGEWLVRWWPNAPTRPALWQWTAADRHLNGHLLLDVACGRLLSTETALDDGRGLVVVRDLHTLAPLHEWPSHGIDPHELLFAADGTLLVANGGVATRPETGRARQMAATAASSPESTLVRLSPHDGRLLGQWRLDDPCLSLRHLARHVSGTVAVALQAEHTEPDARAAAPLLALFDGESLYAAASSGHAAGYAGSVLARTEGFVVSATRASLLMAFGCDGSPHARSAYHQPCALAGGPGDTLWWAGGAGTLLHARLDNHWAMYDKARARPR